MTSSFFDNVLVFVKISHGRRWLLLSCVGASIFLTLNALTAQLDHDESQYVAGAELTAHGLMIFRSFMSLQPPLQAWLYAPVAWVFPTDSFIALRLTTASLALLALHLLYRAQRALGTPSLASTVSCALAMMCGTFLFTSAVVRNDMLGLVLVLAGSWMALAALCDQASGWRGWLAAGLFFGLAASTKLFFAPAALLVGVFLLCGPRAGRWRRCGAYSAGAIVGLLPMLVCAMTAPLAFIWGVLTFASAAPFDWYAAGGAVARLTFYGKAFDLFRYALQGPLLPALVIIAVELFRRRVHVARESLILLLLLLLGGFAGAALPTPTQKQYLLPILPPAFILLGAMLARLPSNRAERRAIIAPLAIMALVGVIKPMRSIAALRNSEAAAFRLDRNAAWIGAQLRSYGDKGDVATLSPDRLAGSGYHIDEYFATGPFVLRSGHILSDNRARFYHVVTPGTLHETLRRHPPAGLLTGYEGDRNYRNLDLQLDRWALQHGYKPLRLPDAEGVLYVCPA